MSIYNEIFGFEDSPKPSTVFQPYRKSPMEDWRWQIAPATGNADVTCQKILDVAFTKAIVGEEIQPAQLVSDQEPVIRTPNAWADLNKLAGKLSKKWESKKHRPAVQGIIDKIRNSPAFEASKHNALWDALVTHATDYVCSTVHAEAGEEMTI